MQELLEDQMNRKMRAAASQNKGKSGNDSDSSQATSERKKSKLFSFLKLGQSWPDDGCHINSSQQHQNINDQSPKKTNYTTIHKVKNII